jgi:hypothetical protein
VEHDGELRLFATDAQMMRIRAQEVRKITMNVMDCSMKSGVTRDGCIDKNTGEVWEKGTAK